MTGNASTTRALGGLLLALVFLPQAGLAQVDKCYWPRGYDGSGEFIVEIDPELHALVKKIGVEQGVAECVHAETVREIEARYGVAGCCSNCATYSQHENACNYVVESDESERETALHQSFMLTLRDYVRSPRIERDYTDATIAAFSRAESAWKSFQAAACEAEVEQNRRGTMQSSFYSQCMVRLSHERRRYLTRLYLGYFDVPELKD